MTNPTFSFRDFSVGFCINEEKSYSVSVTNSSSENNFADVLTECSSHHQGKSEGGANKTLLFTEDIRWVCRKFNITVVQPADFEGQTFSAILGSMFEFDEEEQINVDSLVLEEHEELTENLLMVVDNLLDVEPEQLQQSQQVSNTSARSVIVYLKCFQGASALFIKVVVLNLMKRATEHLNHKNLLNTVIAIHYVTGSNVCHLPFALVRKGEKVCRCKDGCENFIS